MTTPRIAILFAALAAVPAGVFAQQGPEGGLPTQTLVRADSKGGEVLTLSAVTVQVENKPTRLTGLAPVTPRGTQVALLIDDGLSRSSGIQLEDLRAFATALPPGTELLVGYMANGTVRVEVPFTTDHADAAAKIRVPMGVPGESASPYFCLDDFIKHWPGDEGGGGEGSVRDDVDQWRGPV